ncbi:murein biosynthesis integral membrane protein MurJ [Chloroflexota bacterium]
MENSLEQKTSKNSANRQIARAAGIVMAGFVLSNVTSLVRTILTARVFGAGEVLDAFNAAQRLPDILFNLVAGGALASAFIPTLTSFIENDDRRGGWELTSSIINLVIVVLTVVCALTWIFAEPVVGQFLAPKFSTHQQVLTVELLRIMLAAPVIFGISGLLMGVLNTHQRFLLPALAPTLLWLGMIFGLLVFSPSIGIHGLAWGYGLGALLHLLVQLPGVLRLPQRRYRLMLGLRLSAVREVGRLMAPRLLGVAVVQLNFLVNVIVGSGLPAGSLSAIDFAFRIMTMPQVVIAQAISIAALPTFSAQIARGRPDEMRASLASTLRGILFLSLPATLGLILLRRPVIAMLYEGGEFGARDTQMVAWALLWYTIGLVGHSLVEILSRAFYAMHDTRTPVVIGVGTMSLNVLFSFTFPAWFTSRGWLPHGGLALANTLATGLEMVVLLVIMRRRLDGLRGGFIWRGTLKSFLATAAMSAAVLGWLAWAGMLNPWIVGLGGIAVGGAVYVILMFVLRVEEMGVFVNYLRNRLRS